MVEYNILSNAHGLIFTAVAVRQKVPCSNTLMAELVINVCTLIALISTGISLGNFMNQTLIHTSLMKNDEDRKRPLNF